MTFDLRQMDAFELMRSQPDQSVDALFTDPPYGLTDAKWDKAPDWALFWQEVNRITKPHSTIIVFGIGRQFIQMCHPNLEHYRYTIIWEKTISTGQYNSEKRPLAAHEEIGVFCRSPGESIYVPQKYAAPPGYVERKKKRSSKRGELYSQKEVETVYHDDGSRHPTTVVVFKSERGRRIHSTQKPEALMEYLTLTYTQPGDLIFDPYAGSGTTGVAALRHGRRFLGAEISEKYFPQALRRLKTSTVGLFAPVAVGE